MNGPSATANGEVERIVERYRRRDPSVFATRHMFFPERYLRSQEQERAWIDLLRRHFPVQRIERCRLLEVGCGFGKNLLNFLRWGFSPENLVGNELLEDRYRVARRLLPPEVRIVPGDATEMEFPAGSFDIVLQSIVFTSILDDAFQQRLAELMWYWTAPGGGVLWYDFMYDNPRNADVRGVPLRRIRQLFPQGRIRWRRVALAPPLARLAVRIHPLLYHVLGAIPWLRTHCCCWIEKRLPE